MDSILSFHFTFSMMILKESHSRRRVAFMASFWAFRWGENDKLSNSSGGSSWVPYPTNGSRASSSGVQALARSLNFYSTLSRYVLMTSVNASVWWCCVMYRYDLKTSLSWA